VIQIPGCIGNHQYWLRESATGHSKQKIAKPQKHKSPAIAGLSFESWRETRPTKGFSFEHPMLTQAAPGRLNGLK